VHVVQTLQLLEDVPQQPGELYQTYNMGDGTTYKMKLRSPGQEWWNARLWSKTLQSVIVKGRRYDNTLLNGPDIFVQFRRSSSYVFAHKTAVLLR